MTTQKHTPTPWRAEEHPHSYFWTAIYGPNNCRVASVELPMEQSPERHANAAFIVLACNSHERLLEALREIAETYQCETEGCMCMGGEDEECVGATALAAIAAAEGRTE